jgi:hypothetical protein
MYEFYKLFSFNLTERLSYFFSKKINGFFKGELFFEFFKKFRIFWELLLIKLYLYF